MLELILIAAVSGIIVLCIDMYNNNWYNSLLATRRVIVKKQISTLDSRDINYLLEYTGKYIELNNALYNNNMGLANRNGAISTSKAYRILVEIMC
jgi:hypothetical protein